jgi:hypothetical protein
LLIASVVIAPLLVARLAGAHTLGLSTCDFDVTADGHVDARLVFASGEALRGVRLDRNGDGVVTGDEVRASRTELASFVVDGVGVEADGEGCAATFGDAAVDEVDGLVMTASFACPRGAARVEVTLYYLTALGLGHREIARITAGAASAEALLSGDRRQVALVVPGGERSGRFSRGARAAAAAVAVLSGITIALTAWRSRTRRGARSK